MPSARTASLLRDFNCFQIPQTFFDGAIQVAEGYDASVKRVSSVGVENLRVFAQVGIVIIVVKPDRVLGYLARIFDAPSESLAKELFPNISTDHYSPIALAKV